MPWRLTRPKVGFRPTVPQNDAGMRIEPPGSEDRKSTRLNSSHSQISYADFCLQKKNVVPRPAASSHVVTGAESPPRAGDHHDPHAVVHLQLREHLGHVALHRLRRTVEVLGLVH